MNTLDHGRVRKRQSLPPFSPYLQATHSCAFLCCCKHSLGDMGACLKVTWEKKKKKKIVFLLVQVFTEPIPCAITEITVPAARKVVAPRPEEVSGRQIWAEVPVPDSV